VNHSQNPQWEVLLSILYVHAQHFACASADEIGSADAVPQMKIKAPMARPVVRNAIMIASSTLLDGKRTQ
jgi:hypothetical protein